MDLDGHDEEPIILAKKPTPRLLIGQLIEGRLRVVRLLGRGGMSEVYEAFDEIARRTVAVKLLLSDRYLDAQLAVFAEARSLVGFRHPHVVGFYGVGAIEAQPFLELESAPHGSLADWIDADEPMDVAEALDVLIAASDGIASLHTAGVVHRDIKAENILIADGGRPVIADFGLAMHTNDLPALPNGIVGTPAYMAPEAILGITESFEQYAAADQYSLAVTAYLALTGTPPVEGSTASGLFYAQMAVEPELPSRRRPDLPTALDAVLCRALSKRPADRFASVAGFRDALIEIRSTMGPVLSPSLRESGVRSVASSEAPSLRPTMVAAQE